MDGRSILLRARHDIHAAHIAMLGQGHRTEDLVVVVRSTKLTLGTLADFRASDDLARDLTYHRDFPTEKRHHLRAIVELPSGPAFVALDTTPSRRTEPS